MPNLSKTLTVYEGADLTPANDRTDETVWLETELAAGAHDGEAEAGQWVVHNDDGETIFFRPHNPMKLVVGSNTIWQGRVAARQTARGDTTTGDHRLHTVTVEDQNSHLRGIIVHNWSRPEETDAARVQALVSAYLSGSPRASTNLNGSNYVVTGSNTITLPAQIYSGIEPFDILGEIAAQTDKTFFVSVDDELHYYGNDYTGYSSILRISDDIADLNTVTCVPINPNESQFSREVINVQRMYWRNPRGEGDERTVQHRSDTIINQQDYWEGVYHDSESPTLQRATTSALARFNAAKRAEFSHAVTIGAPGTLPQTVVNPQGQVGTAGQPMTGDDVWKVKPGQLIAYKSTVLRGADAGFFTRRIKSIRWTFPAADSYFATLEIEQPRLKSRPKGHPYLQNSRGTRENLLEGTAVGSIKVYDESALAAFSRDMAVDGDDGTHWSASSAAGQPVADAWAAFDMGTARRADAMRILTDNPVEAPDDVATEVRLYGTNDAAKWSAITDESGHSSTISDGWDHVSTWTTTLASPSDSGLVPFEEHTYRYWLFRAISGGTDEWDVNEFEIWGYDSDIQPLGDSNDNGDSGDSAPADHVHAHGTFSSGDYHTEYVREASSEWVDLTDGGETALHSHADTGSGISVPHLLTAHVFPIIARRGDINPTDGYPENTLEGCRQAMKRGAQGFEFDIQRNADGSWVVMHDTTVTRTTDGTGNVADKTDADWAALNIDGGFGYDAGRHGTSLAPPFMDDVLDAVMPYDPVIWFDLKEGGTGAGHTTAATALATYVVTNDLVERSIINCYSLAAAAAVKAVNATIETSVLNTVTTSIEGEANVDRGYFEIDTITDAAFVNARAPKAVDNWLDTADKYDVDETPYISDSWEFGVRTYHTHDLAFAVAWRSQHVNSAITNVFHPVMAQDPSDSRWYVVVAGDGTAVMAEAP